MTVKIEVFTSPTCPHCPGAVKIARELQKERDDIVVLESSTGTMSGSKRAKHYGIMTVPTTLVHGKDGPIGLKGVPAKQTLEKSINIAQGKQDFPKEQGLFQSIIEKIKQKVRKNERI